MLHSSNCKSYRTFSFCFPHPPFEKCRGQWECSKTSGISGDYYRKIWGAKVHKVAGLLVYVIGFLKNDFMSIIFSNDNFLTAIYLIVRNVYYSYCNAPILLLCLPFCIYPFFIAFLSLFIRHLAFYPSLVYIMYFRFRRLSLFRSESE